jgi:hypothetical protein
MSVRVCLPQCVQEMALTWPRLAHALPAFLRFFAIYGDNFIFNNPNIHNI